jgi:hypothetical protein
VSASENWFRNNRRHVDPGGRRAEDQPWRCLWRGFEEQITKTFPFRRTILQPSQIRLMLDRTFMIHPSIPRPPAVVQSISVEESSGS